MNLTPKRRQALRTIQQRPGLTAQDLAYAISERGDGRGRGNGGGIRWPQMATCWGARCVKPLIEAQLVRREQAWPGWGRLYLTDSGRAVAISGEAP